MKRYIIIIILIVFAILVAWILWKNKKTLKSEELLSESVVEVIPVQVQKLVRQNIDEKFEFSGILKPERELMVISQTQGQVERVYYDLGDHVSAGQTIVQVENEMLAAQAKVAKANFEKAGKDLERFEKMAEVDGVTRDQLEKMRLNLTSAEAQYMSMKKRLEDTSVKAPFQGFINQMFTKEGSMLGSGVPVFEIVDVSGYKMNIKCSEDEIVHISKGKNVRVHTKLFENIEMEGRVSRVSVSADMAQQYTVKISIDDVNDDRIKGGMVAVAQITGNTYPGVMAIDRSYIRQENGRKFVYVAENQIALKRSIIPGISVNEMVVIEEGVQEGDAIIISGAHQLSEGQKIKIIP